MHSAESDVAGYVRNNDGNKSGMKATLSIKLFTRYPATGKFQPVQKHKNDDGKADRKDALVSGGAHETLGAEAVASREWPHTRGGLWDRYCSF
jgi:hypothetical protein